MQRRQFFSTALTGLAAAGTVGDVAARPSLASEQVVTIIDIDRCDGCPDRETPRCVAACRNEKRADFPEPVKPLRPYWPQTKFEDHSNDRENISRLTPYNYLYLQTIEVDGKTHRLPRRCMQCYDATCRKVCPFGAIDKTREGAVKINEKLCFGGAKCRDVCPWHIPQRQAGVGLYLDIAPKFAGGGVMYKCDHCASRLAKGELPACTAACPTGAIMTGTLSEMHALIDVLARDRYVYGRDENGGTATWYVSSVPFEKLEAARREATGPVPPQGEPDLARHSPSLAKTNTAGAAALAAPFVAVGAAILLKKKRLPNTRDTETQKEDQA